MLGAVKALVLDFDGVIADSAREAFHVACETYSELFQPKRLPTLSSKALYAAFVALMPLGNRAEDYAVALRALEADLALTDQATYAAFFAAQDPAELRRFHKRFYEVRARFAREQPAAWGRLLPPYPEVIALLQRRAGQVRFAIATSKDRHSVRALLRDYGIEQLFPEDCVLDKETGVSKASHLSVLQERLGVAFEEMTFLDDKVSHLDSVAPLQVRCALAVWGYNGPREHALAQQSGYLLCRLEDMEEQLFERRAAAT